MGIFGWPERPCLIWDFKAKREQFERWNLVVDRMVVMAVVVREVYSTSKRSPSPLCKVLSFIYLFFLRKKSFIFLKEENGFY